MLNKIEISLNKNTYTIKYNGFTQKTTNEEYIINILNKNYGKLLFYTKTGNDLNLHFERIIIQIKSIRNLKKKDNNPTLYTYLSTFNDYNILKLVK